ncbi:uncharacterized protein LOC131211203 [Anopheles bellator]|uniref:uncharacterized protein LOC131211203 n=1 Tax=Anopheles bellator TaxID=139047 RepID=UPI0026491261|nr:uncharacterized protein LOC131211203 [Anopheles bellator]
MAPRSVRSPKTDHKVESSFEDLKAAIDKLNPSETDLYAIFAPVRACLWRRLLLKWFKITIGCLVAGMVIYYVPTVNWHVTAVGRLLMIELLPFWDWTPLYRSKCIITKATADPAPTKVEPLRLLSDDCVVCENLASIPKRENVSYESLFRHHLMRQIPIVVPDGQSMWEEHERYGGDWSRFLADVEDLLLSNPCDLQTNLLFQPSTARPTALARMVDLLAPDTEREESKDNVGGWFVQFRNCALRTVKKTRIMFRKPYFYAAHWESPFTSWFLLSAGYGGNREIRPNMAGLVIVSQLRSALNVTLEPRYECEARCRTVRLMLQERQSLLFSTTLWSFSYSPSQQDRASVTFVSETYDDV